MSRRRLRALVPMGQAMSKINPFSANRERRRSLARSVRADARRRTRAGTGAAK